MKLQKCQFRFHKLICDELIFIFLSKEDVFRGKEVYEMVQYETGWSGS